VISETCYDSGHMHVGRSWLDIRARGGRFVVRLENLDPVMARVRTVFVRTPDEPRERCRFYFLPQTGNTPALLNSWTSRYGSNRLTSQRRNAFPAKSSRGASRKPRFLAPLTMFSM